MRQVSILGAKHGLADLLAKALERRGDSVIRCNGTARASSAGPLEVGRSRSVVYAPGGPDADAGGRPRSLGPDTREAEDVLGACAEARVRHLVVLSSAAAHEPTHHHPGMVGEDRLAACRTQNAIPRRWRQLEKIARRVAGETEMRLTVLRPAAVVGSSDPVADLLNAPLAVVVAGYDPTVQLLDAEDLAAALARALEHSPEPRSVDTFHVAPAAPIRLRQALRLAGARFLSVPWSLHASARSLLASSSATLPAAAAAYRRYPWTVSGERASQTLGWRPRRTSAGAIQAWHGRQPPSAREPETNRLPRPSNPRRAPNRPDPFGMDPEWIDRLGRGLLGFLHDRWFRMETAGLEHVPDEGRAVLAGVHRGFVPFDAMMALHLLAREKGRYPRFLVHPGLLKLPISFDVITRLGGVIACRENAAWVLEGEEIAGILMEGVRGAFRPYREAYRLGRFMRDEFVKIALVHRAPIVPMVTVGSAEVFPILTLLEPRWWKRWSEWPGFPITPTFPLLPLPLPAKFHTRFLPAVHVEREHPPEAAENPEVVAAISAQVRAGLKEAMTEILRNRPSVFVGSAFR